jgi:hypothetical protein
MLRQYRRKTSLALQLLLHSGECGPPDSMTAWAFHPGPVPIGLEQTAEPDREAEGIIC